MRFLLKLSILLLAFQAVFGKSYYQRQQEKKRKAVYKVAVDSEVLKRNYCNDAQNYYAETCVVLRANDAARAAAAETLAHRKAYCATDKYDFACMTEFGAPEPWNTILTIVLCIPLLFIGMLLC